MLTFVRLLIEKYGQKILDNTITPHEVDKLLHQRTFPDGPKTTDHTQALTDENYSRLEAVRLFILSLSRIPGMNNHILKAFAGRMIAQLPNNIPSQKFPSKFPQLILSCLAYLAAHNDVDVTQEQALLASKISNASKSNAHLSRVKLNMSLESFHFKNVSVRLENAMILTEENTITENNLKADVAPPAAKANSHCGSRASSIENPRYEEFAAQLRAYEAHYSHPATQAHQAIWNPHKKTKNGELQAVAKARVAHELIDVFTHKASITMLIPEYFENLLIEHGLENPTNFFVGTKEKVQLNLELELFLSPYYVHIRSAEEAPFRRLSACQHTVFNVPAEAKQKTDQIEFLLINLDKFHKHYSNPLVQARERIEGKKNTAPLKANISQALIRFINENKKGDVNAEFSRLLLGNKIKQEEFFHGKSMKYLTLENQALLTTEIAARVTAEL